MKKNTGKSASYLTKYVIVFFIVLLLQSCTSTSTSVVHLDGDDFVKNLPGQWEGNWYWHSEAGKIRINIIEIDENNVNLTGFSEGGGSTAPSDEVYGRLENSILLLTWPLAGEGGGGVKEKYKMIRDDSNNLILDGRWTSLNYQYTGRSQLKKIE